LPIEEFYNGLTLKVGIINKRAELVMPVALTLALRIISGHFNISIKKTGLKFL